MMKKIFYLILLSFLISAELNLSSAQEIKPFQPRDDFKRPLEPKGNYIMHGAGQRAWEFATYWFNIGDLKPSLTKRYHSVGSDPQSARLHELPMEIASFHPSGLCLDLSMSWAQKYDSLGERIPGCLSREILDGKLDNNLDLIALAIKKMKGQPVLLRPGYEFNGHWNAYDKNLYAETWRYIHNRFAKHQLKNVAWVWCWIPESDMDWQSYYPGNEFVDWWGIDLFWREHFFDAATSEFLNEARKRKFPVFIAEAAPRKQGVAPTNEAWEHWFVPFWNLIADHPNIKAFIYINREWPLWEKYKADWVDSRLEHNPELMKKWAEILKRPEILNANQWSPNRIYLP